MCTGDRGSRIRCFARATGSVSSVALGFLRFRFRVQGFWGLGDVEVPAFGL